MNIKQITPSLGLLAVINGLSKQGIRIQTIIETIDNLSLITPTRTHFNDCLFKIEPFSALVSVKVSIFHSDRSLQYMLS